MMHMQHRKQSARQETGPSDDMLLGKSLAGDEFAFEALVNRYRSPLLKHIRRTTYGYLCESAL